MIIVEFIPTWTGTDTSRLLNSNPIGYLLYASAQSSTRLCRGFILPGEVDPTDELGYLRILRRSYDPHLPSGFHPGRVAGRALLTFFTGRGCQAAAHMSRFNFLDIPKMRN